jgi:hypothetical protein
MLQQDQETRGIHAVVYVDGYGLPVAAVVVMPWCSSAAAGHAAAWFLTTAVPADVCHVNAVKPSPLDLLSKHGL